MFGSSLIAQTKDTESADKLYHRLEYIEAAQGYEKLVNAGKADGYVYKQLGDSYYNIFNTAEASKWYAKAVETQQDAETYFRYAQMLKAEGKYDQANKQMDKFAQMAPSDTRAIAHKKDPNYLPKLRSQSKLYNEQAVSFNSEQSDFGAVLSNDNYLYFASARNKSRKNYGWNDEPYLDIYQAVYNADGTFAEPVALGSLNSKWHEGPMSVSADGKTAYFTSESFKEGDFVREKSAKLKQGQNYIYRASKTGDSWGDIQEASFNSKDYSVTNPSISADGKTLYFSSNMPGSLGGFDIFKVAVNADGSYGTPQNLGPRVNTPGNEGFPFIAEDNKLYFASDARNGFGGLDVFMIDLNSSEDPQNLGAPINTAKDDFAFSFNVQKNIGFFSSNRNGNDDIFMATPICNTDIVTTVKDAKTGAILANAQVAILDDKNNVIERKQTDSNGVVSYKVDCERTFTIQASKDGYDPGSFPVAKTTGKKQAIAADLQPIEVIIVEDQVVLNEIYFEFNKSNITPEGAKELDRLVNAMNTKTDLVIMVKAHTDSRGSDAYNKALSERRAKSTVQYILSKGIAKNRISGKGYGESEPKVDCGDNCSEEQHQANRRSEFLIVKE